MLGETGEFTIGKREGDSIVYLLVDRHPGKGLPEPVPFDSDFGEPMRRALSGLSGTVIGPDYHGDTVLAAHEPIPELGLGVVAKIDIAEIRAPFIRAGLAAGLATVLVVVIGALFFLKISEAVMRDLRETNDTLTLRTAEITRSNQQLDTVVNATHILLAYMDPEFNFVWVNRAYAEADGKDPAFFFGKNHFDLFPYGENREIFDEVVRTGKPYYAYARAFEYADNPERGVSYWDWTLVPTKDGDGNVTGVLFSLADVTERIRMEQSLRVSEEKYRLLVESANSVITVTQDGVIRFINEQVKDLLGYSAEELIGKETAVIFNDDQKDKTWGQSREEISGRALAPSTRQILHKNGDIRYIEVVGTLMMWEGRPAILNVFTDITERKRAEALIQIRGTLFEYAVSHPLEEMLQRTMDEVCELTGSPIGFFHFVQSDQNTLSLQAWSTRTTREFCTAPGKGMHYAIETAGVWVECVRQRQPVIHNDYSALTNRKGFPEGHPAVVRELVVPVMRSGQITAILGVGNKTTNYDQKDVEVVSYLADVAWEIAEGKLAEEALRDSEQRYHSLFTNILDGFAYHKMIFDEQNTPVDYLYLEINDAFERLTGLNGVVGKRVTEIIPAIREDNPELLETYGRVSLTGTPEEFETYVPALNSWFSVSVYSPQRGYFVTVFDNITDRKRAEEMIVASLAEKEALLREIHHRVKNNLQTVSSLLSMAAMGTKNREAGDLMRDAESRVHAMALIHSQLYGSQRLDRIDVKRNIRELADRLSSIYSGPARNIVHSVEGDDTSLTIHQAIPTALAVNEIVTNAFKYAFEGRQTGAISIVVGRKKDTVSITITDNGIGLPDGFDVESSDTLGLRLVKNLIEGQLAGKVVFTSSGGTSVTMSFEMEGQKVT